ncbi:MAG: hypothetical protein JWL94_662 [Microbacteriaceae bacterium]|jgi:hypothetical protein|nr:hypothetical protein [Microbacteriaceae bacterium]HEV7957505.1 DUF6264 family protein [Marisediminicola sp.]
MNDERPRPKYGEYATPQNQAEAIAGSLPPVSPVLRPHAGETPAATPSGRERPRRRWDLILSAALLAYGFVNVVVGLVQYSNVAEIVNQAYELQGIGEFTSTEFADSIGMAISVINVALYAVTALITVRLLRARRIAFYVPLIGGALAAIVVGALLLTLMFGDPAFLSYVNRSA